MDASSPLEPSGAAAILARKAAEDATAVREFAANSEIADGIIGFHAQQATSCEPRSSWRSSPRSALPPGSWLALRSERGRAVESRGLTKRERL